MLAAGRLALHIPAGRELPPLLPGPKLWHFSCHCIGKMNLQTKGKKKNDMRVREIDKTEVHKLLGCIVALSAYHNQASINFKGCYPSRPYADTLRMFADNLENGISQIGIVENSEKVIGFCKIDMHHNAGKLDYLVVLEEYRGKGYGKMLMDWAMEQFAKRNICCIAVKVVDGNEAIHLYEKYGFKMNAHLLWRKHAKV